MLNKVLTNYLQLDLLNFQLVNSLSFLTSQMLRSLSCYSAFTDIVIS